MVLAWFVVAVVLVLFELHHLAFYALFGAIGCLAAAGVAAFAPSAIPVQGAVAVGVAMAGVVSVRPLVSTAFASHRAGGSHPRGVHGGLQGHEAITLDEVGDPHVVGHVRLAGERWLAVSGNGGRIAANTNVVVVSTQGTTLVVWPTDELTATPDKSRDPDRDEMPGGADGRLP